MYSLKDNIVALATMPGKSALNIIRLTGDKSVVKIFHKLTHLKKTPKPNTTYPYLIYSDNKQIIDQSVVTYYKSPKSYTGEFMLEISVHGGHIIAGQVIDLILNMNCRMAGPGEFTYRAFINDKINLIQAEAINGIINADTALNSSYQVINLTGGLAETITNVHKKIKNMLVLAEHELDFSEEEITLTQERIYINRLIEINKIIKDTLERACHENNTHCPRVVIVGKPNAGKSSLFNKIVGYDKAIVTNIKGTTRDVVEVQLSLSGKNINLMDTAGIRKTANKIEKLGIKKTKEEIQKADIVLVLDELNPQKQIIQIKNHNKKATWVSIINKIDCVNSSKKADFSISCKNNLGINELLTWLSTKIESIYSKNYESGNIMINERQNKILRQIEARSSTVAKKYKKHHDLVLLCSDLRNILICFNDLIKPVDNGQILEEIFGGFCVGK